MLEESSKVSPTLALLKEDLLAKLDVWNYWEDQDLVSKPQWYLDAFGGDGQEGEHFILYGPLGISNDLGYFETSSATSQMMDRVTIEVKQACADGRLQCKRILAFSR